MGPGPTPRDAAGDAALARVFGQVAGSAEEPHDQRPTVVLVMHLAVVPMSAAPLAMRGLYLAGIEGVLRSSPGYFARPVFGILTVSSPLVQALCIRPFLGGPDASHRLPGLFSRAGATVCVAPVCTRAPVERIERPFFATGRAALHGESLPDSSGTFPVKHT